jgi:hypothetical protein
MFVYQQHSWPWIEYEKGGQQNTAGTKPKVEDSFYSNLPAHTDTHMRADIHMG